MPTADTVANTSSRRHGPSSQTSVHLRTRLQRREIRVVHQAPIDVSSSSSEGETDIGLSLANNTDPQPRSRAGAWIPRTPPGSPPTLLPSAPPLSQLADEPVPPYTAPHQHNEPPPDYTYYLQPAIEEFGFPHEVSHILADHSLTARQLTRIQSILDYGIQHWIPTFQEIGIEASVARSLQKDIVAVIDEERLAVLRIACLSI